MRTRDMVLVIIISGLVVVGSAVIIGSIFIKDVPRPAAVNLNELSELMEGSAQSISDMMTEKLSAQLTVSSADLTDLETFRKGLLTEAMTQAAFDRNMALDDMRSANTNLAAQVAELQKRLEFYETTLNVSRRLDMFEQQFVQTRNNVQGILRLLNKANVGGITEKKGAQKPVEVPKGP